MPQTQVILSAEEFLPETEIWDLTTKEKEIVYRALKDFAAYHIDRIQEESAQNHKFRSHLGGLITHKDAYLYKKKNIYKQ